MLSSTSGGFIYFGKKKLCGVLLFLICMQWGIVIHIYMMYWHKIVDFRNCYYLIQGHFVYSWWSWILGSRLQSAAQLPRFNIRGFSCAPRGWDGFAALDNLQLKDDLWWSISLHQERKKTHMDPWWALFSKCGFYLQSCLTIFFFYKRIIFNACILLFFILFLFLFTPQTNLFHPSKSLGDIVPPQKKEGKPKMATTAHQKKQLHVIAVNQIFNKTIGKEKTSSNPFA